MSEFNAAVDRVIGKLRQGWVKETYALDEHDESVICISPKACKFCLSGAIISLRNPVMEQKIRTALTAIGIQSLPIFNDAQDIVDPIIQALESIKVQTCG